MKLRSILILAAMTLNAAPAGLTGAWKVVFAGDRRTAPKTIGSIILDLRVDGNLVAGRVRIGSWPGEAPIADGRVEGDHITFLATGTHTSSTGIPTFKFDVTMHNDEMQLTMTAIKNAPAPGHVYQYVGNRTPDYSSATLTRLP